MRLEIPSCPIDQPANDVLSEGARYPDPIIVSREKLYEEVWAEPMIQVAARYKVSSGSPALLGPAWINAPKIEEKNGPHDDEN